MQPFMTQRVKEHLSSRSDTQIGARPHDVTLDVCDWGKVSIIDAARKICYLEVSQIVYGVCTKNSKYQEVLRSTSRHRKYGEELVMYDDQVARCAFPEPVALVPTRQSSTARCSPSGERRGRSVSVTAVSLFHARCTLWGELGTASYLSYYYLSRR